MIKRLRWKMVGINMAIVTAVLLTVFASVFFISRAGLARESTLALEEALQTGTYDPLTPGQAAGSRPCFVAVVYDGGTVRVSGSSYYRFDDEQTLLAIIQDCLDQTDDEGVLRDYQLRYLRVQTPLTTRIAFTDSSGEQSTLRQLLRSSLLLGLGALAVLFGFSYLLSGLAVRPVERAWNEQQRFVSDASHELKTPLTVILSSSDLLAQEESPTKRAPYLDNIRAESQRMRRLVEGMLTLARGDSGRAKTPMEPVALSELANETAMSFEPVAFEAGHPLEYELAENLTVRGRADELRQVFAILLDNAVKYAPAGAPVRLTLRESGRDAALEVENPGDPIPPEQLAHLFDRFYRADASRSDHEGFGLGLSIAQSIVTAHRGTIRCRSDAQGTCFTVTLPLQK